MKTRKKHKGGTPAVRRTSPLFRRQTTKMTSPYKRSASFKENLSFLKKCNNSNTTEPNISCMTCKKTGEIETLRIFGEEYIKEQQQQGMSGSFGSIVKYTNASKTETYAVKSFVESPKEDPYFEEIIILQLLKMEKKYPKYLISAYPVILEDCYFNIMHFKEDTLLSLKKTPAILEKNKDAIFNDIVNGLISLASMSYLYGDLKAANTLFTLRKDNKVKIYLADLGGIAPYGKTHWNNMIEKIGEFYDSTEIPNTQKDKIRMKYTSDPAEMIYSIASSPFTYPTKYYYPIVNANTDLCEYLCHFFHQIVIMYLFLNGHDIRIFEHDKVIQSRQQQVMFMNKTTIPEQLLPYYNVHAMSKTIRKYKSITDEKAVVSEIVKDLGGLCPPMTPAMIKGHRQGGYAPDDELILFFD